MTGKILCVMDAFWKRPYSLKKDSTLLLLSEFQKIGYEPHLIALEDLAKVDPIGFDLIMMRKDPPVDGRYLKACRLLKSFKRTTPVMNDPTAMLRWSEKSIILNFPRWIPPTLITKKLPQAIHFLKTHGRIILKPLNGYAGKGVKLIKSKGQLSAVFRSLRTPVMLQAYLEAIQLKGEKRIFMIDGRAYGALLKKPRLGTFLANPDLGAVLSTARLSKKEMVLCREVGKFLKKNGIFFAGLDVIDERLTEINFTSPGLLWEWNELTHQRHERKIVAYMIKHAKQEIR